MADSLTDSPPELKPIARLRFKLRDLTVTDTTLTIDTRKFSLDQITRLQVIRDTESGAFGHLVGIAIFIGFFALFLIPIIEEQLDPKFLFVVAIAGAIALSLLQDLINHPGKEMYRLWVTARDGRRILYFAQNKTEIDGVLAELTGRTGIAAEFVEAVAEQPAAAAASVRPTAATPPRKRPPRGAAATNDFR